MAASESIHFWNPPLQITLFLKTQTTRKNYGTNCFLTILVFTKKTPRESLSFFCSTYKPFFTVTRYFCRTSALVLTFFFLPFHSRPFIYRKVRAISFGENRFSSYIKTYYKTPAKLKILTKHIEFPRLYSFSLL